MAGALALRFVHQFVGPLNQVGGEPPCDESAIGDASEPEADYADVDADRLRGQTTVFEGPVVALDRFTEAFRDGVRLVIFGQIGNLKAEFVAAEARVQILRLRPAGPFLRQQVVGPDLFAQQLRDPFDNLIADGVTQGVVVPLESGDIDQSDRAPAAALLEGEKRFELLGEPGEVHQLRFRVAMRAIGQLGDEAFEVVRNAADRGILGGELGLHTRHLVGEPGGKRLNRLLLRLLPQALVPREHRVDRRQERCFEMRRQVEMFADPGLQIVSSLRRERWRGRHFLVAHWHLL